ncbi:MAG TPA: NUDIX hydrolase [Cyclobacteriaceae bacterium]
MIDLPVKIFINDIIVEISKKNADSQAQSISEINFKKNLHEINQLPAHIIISDASNGDMVGIIKKLTCEKIDTLKTISLIASDPLKTFDFIQSKLTIVNAAGGLVTKQDRILFIYRKNLWDLPKGKIEKKEKPELAALREVEEETGVKANLGKLIGSTLHTYYRSDKYYLKKTSWYAMDCFDDKNIKPQSEEEITALRWMTKNEAIEAAKKTYKSIDHVISQYYNL